MGERFKYNQDGTVEIGRRSYVCALPLGYTLFTSGHELVVRLVFLVNDDNGWALCLSWGSSGACENWGSSRADLHEEPETVEVMASWLGWEHFEAAVNLADQTPADVNALIDRMVDWEPGVVGAIT